MELPLTLQLKPSRAFLALLISGHTLAGVAVFLLPLPVWGRVLAVLGLGVLLLRSWSRATRQVQSVTLRSDGKLSFLLADGQVREATVAAATVVLPYLVIMHSDSKV